MSVCKEIGAAGDADAVFVAVPLVEMRADALSKFTIAQKNQFRS